MGFVNMSAYPYYIKFPMRMLASSKSSSRIPAPAVTIIKTTSMTIRIHMDGHICWTMA